ncbi:sugar phosphate permease [Pseudomonas protegens]|jgi:sugar phosphate permease|uniref:MFS transporter n=1 Tax=Pseudomonas protegens TaxID=380021 RepID=UPI000F47409F|nr:MFS transporter [Pseudomonas protegens]MBP5098222.1 MFS transporter [Pseudomonas protegens]MBP5119048.1 MFS transporter [Pseudomonas protegens]MBP5121122.1 MFS transporter [Pseudomonas protegens]MDT3419071.1 sugar phosphate permease [Pseudomonas protegens]NMZ28768.1 MFS transporter [Pseudomonas protegens]
MTTTTITVQDPHASPEHARQLDTLYARIRWRLLPLLMLCYMVAFLDRVNIGYAQLQMKQTLPFGDAVYGLGAGIFFIGYFIFEVPSNLMLKRSGVRKTLLRIMFCWGLVAAAMMFVSTPMQFYVLRFLLGAFEAGFFPGVILYFTYWFPAPRRGQVIAIFMTAAAVAGLIAGPVSGSILKYLDGAVGLHGWQWMFMIQGLPASVLGVVAFLYLQDSPARARWLSPGEKRLLDADMARDLANARDKSQDSLAQMFRDPRIYLLSTAYFMFLGATYMLVFWMPSLIQGWGSKDLLQVGLITAIPNIVGIVGMVLIGQHSDKHRERRWHFVGCMAIAVFGLAVTTLLNGHLLLSVTALGFAYVGIKAGTPIFFALVSEYLSVAATAGGIAFISSLGNLGPAVTPWLNGVINSHTGGHVSSMYLGIVMYLLAGGLVLVTARIARVPKVAAVVAES